MSKRILHIVTCLILAGMAAGCGEDAFFNSEDGSNDIQNKFSLLRCQLDVNIDGEITENVVYSERNDCAGILGEQVLPAEVRIGFGNQLQGELAVSLVIPNMVKNVTAQGLTATVAVLPSLSVDDTWINTNCEVNITVNKFLYEDSGVDVQEISGDVTCPGNASAANETAITISDFTFTAWVYWAPTTVVDIKV